MSQVEAKNNSIAIATELFFNEEMAQKMPCIMRRLILNSTLKSNTSDFSIYVNPETAQDTLYPSLIYTNEENISESYIEDYKRVQNLYDLGNVTLREIAILEIAVNRTTGTQDTLNYTLNISEAFCQNYLVKEKIDILRSRCFNKETSRGSVLPESEDFKLVYRTLKNSSAIFTYSLNSGKKEQIIIPIDQYNTPYVFEF